MLCFASLLGNAEGLSSALTVPQGDFANPVVVRSGAPGKLSKPLPPFVKAILPPRALYSIRHAEM